MTPDAPDAPDAPPGSAAAQRSDGRGVGPRAGALLSAAHRAGPYAIAVLGLLLAWLGQITLRLRGLARLPVVALAAVAILVALACLIRLAWWRSWAVRAWLLAWLGWVAATALGWRGIPAAAAGTARDEVRVLAASAALASAMIVAARGHRRGVAGFRWLWLAVLVTTAPVALREIVTDEHIVVTRWIEWYFHPHIPAGTFANPNDYACVLVAVTGSLLAWSLDRVRAWARVALLAGVALAIWLTWTAESRGAVAAIAVQLLFAVLGLAARAGLADAVRRSRRVAAAAGGVIAVGLLAAIAAFVVPALAAHNPLLRSPKPGEEASDDMRLALIRAGLRFWQSSPWHGTGAGTYEYRLEQAKPPDVRDPSINAHNGFVELLSQYGLIAAVPLTLLLLLLLWYVVRPVGTAREVPTVAVPIDEPRGPDPSVLSRRVELACLLPAYVVTALVVSSSLAQPLWFVMLGHAVAVAWSLERDQTTPISRARKSAGELEPGDDRVEFVGEAG